MRWAFVADVSFRRDPAYAATSNRKYGEPTMYRGYGIIAGCALAASTAAQDLTIYDEALRNGFVGDYSYGGGSDFASTAEAHGGTHSVAFTGNDFNAVSFTNPDQAFALSQYPKLHFWIHGGTAGGQQLEIFACTDETATTCADAPLDGFVAGGSIAANQWREVTVPLTSPPLSLSGAIGRIDLQNQTTPGAQPTLYIDDMSLVRSGGGGGDDAIFADGFDTPTAANLLVDEHDVTAGGMTSDRFTWNDASGQPRVAVLAHNDAGAGPGGTRGGELREFRYQVGGATRIVRASSSGAAGFGYVVSHPISEDFCTPGHGDTSALGHLFPGTWTRVFEGRHHAIFRFRTTYPRYCTTGAPAAEYDVPVTIDWMFSTGRDHPLWAVTWDLSSAPADALEDDSRAPYGELLFDGSATEGEHAVVAGVGWGDRYKFASTSNPVTYDGAWTWNVANTIPYVKLWTTDSNATMGTVETQTILQQDAGGYFGTDRWNTTSADGNACDAGNDGASAHSMPCSFNWPYQSINYSMGEVIGESNSTPTNNTRLAWGTEFGFLGQSAYHIHGSEYWGGPLPDATAPGWPKKSYSVHVVLGTHSNDPVDAEVAEIETVQTLALSAAHGSVATSGPAGVNRSDTATYAPPGYDHVYGTLAFVASGNALDATIAVGAGRTLHHPIVVVRGFAGGTYPQVRLDGAPLTMDADYFPSLRADAQELWITLGANLGSGSHHLEVVP
jgi:hypothetical protein